MAFEKELHKGHSFRKGKESPVKLKKVEKFKHGLPVECKKHGEHLKWRLHSDNNVQCLFCASQWQMNQRRRNPLRFIYRDAKKHAERNNRKFCITLEDLIKINELQENKCSLTGIQFDNDNPPSLDRINSELGYTLDNIQLILIQVNRMKSNFTQIEFINMCYRIVAYSQARNSKKKGKKNVSR